MQGSPSLTSRASTGEDTTNRGWRSQNTPKDGKRAALQKHAVLGSDHPRKGPKARIPRYALPAHQRKPSPAPTPASQRPLACVGRPSARQRVCHSRRWPLLDHPRPTRTPCVRDRSARAVGRRWSGVCRRARSRTRTGPGSCRAPVRTHARTTYARGPGRGPDRGAQAAAETAGRRSLGPLPGRHVHSPIVKDIPVAGRQPRPSGHFFPLPALRERRTLPPLPLHRARLLRPPLPSPPGPPVSAAASAVSSAVAATYRGCSGPQAPTLHPKSGARRLCRPLSPLPALASPRSGGPLRPPARARGRVLRRRHAGPAPRRQRQSAREQAAQPASARGYRSPRWRLLAVSPPVSWGVFLLRLSPCPRLDSEMLVQWRIRVPLTPQSHSIQILSRRPHPGPLPVTTRLYIPGPI